MEKYLGSEQHKHNARVARKKGRQVILENRGKRRKQYEDSPNVCQHCKKPLEFEKRYNKYCSSSCSAKVTNVGKIHSEESREKTRQKIRAFRVEKRRIRKELGIPLKKDQKIISICTQCGKEFETVYPKRKTCSEECAHAWKRTPEAREANRQRALERVKNGTHKGWMSRTGLKPSYPEQYFINLFQAEKIEGWTREYPAGSRYFIDFAFPKLNLAVEVDGGQHEWEENKRKDLEKDTYLTSTGWKVFRIKWRNPVNEKNREFLYPQIAELKKLLGR